MIECTILFAYHAGDKVTLRHYELFRQHNPNFPVIPLVMRDKPVIPYTVDLADFPSKWNTNNNWYTLDTRIYLFFENRYFDSERYVFTEWDVRCGQSVEDFYRAYGMWDEPVVSADFLLPDVHPTWSNWPERAHLAPELQPYVCAIAPCAMTLFSHDALDKIVREAIAMPHSFSEIRLGTAARKAGFWPKTYGIRTVCADPRSVPRSKTPGIYHPVKNLEWWDD